MRQFGDLEAAVMDELWGVDGPLTVRNVMEALSPQRPLAYTTVMTVMDTLHRKGWLARERAGRAFLYSPSATREQYSAGLMAEALATSDDSSATFLRFISDLDPREATLLREAMDKSTRRRRAGKR